jgi:two-component system response regulator NreC
VKKLRILLADDHALLRTGVRGVLENNEAWKIVGEAGKGLEAIEKAKTLKPDLVIVDISLPDIDGLQVARQIRETIPTAKVLVLTMHESDQIVRRAIDAGAHGFVLKSDLTDRLVKAVKDVSLGKGLLAPRTSMSEPSKQRIANGVSESSKRLHSRITPREVQVIRLLALGRVNKEVASDLGITVRTVETHRAKIMDKLGIHLIAELVHYAIRKNLIPVSDGLQEKRSGIPKQKPRTRTLPTHFLSPKAACTSNKPRESR